MILTPDSVDQHGNITMSKDTYNVHTHKMTFMIEGYPFTPFDCVIEINGCNTCGENTINLPCDDDEDGEKELVVCKECNTLKLNITEVKK